MVLGFAVGGIRSSRFVSFVEVWVLFGVGIRVCFILGFDFCMVG